MSNATVWCCPNSVLNQTVLLGTIMSWSTTVTVPEVPALSLIFKQLKIVSASVNLILLLFAPTNLISKALKLDFSGPLRLQNDLVWPAACCGPGGTVLPRHFM